jgi:hypothetical protein
VPYCEIYKHSLHWEDHGNNIGSAIGRKGFRARSLKTFNTLGSIVSLLPIDARRKAWCAIGSILGDLPLEILDRGRGEENLRPQIFRLHRSLRVGGLES